MPDSQLVHAIALNSALRLRIEAIVRGRMVTAGITATERALLDTLPLDHLSWAASANPTIFAAIKAALSGTDVDAAVQTVTDTDLEFVVASELTFLA